jgi:hypothetical protein
MIKKYKIRKIGNKIKLFRFINNINKGMTKKIIIVTNIGIKYNIRPILRIFNLIFLLINSSLIKFNLFFTFFLPSKQITGIHNNIKEITITIILLFNRFKHVPSQKYE